ncbi:LytTR family DNA-binding domain-containing protein [Treponema sp.]|uniref:LytTR family DNA-binding domain-containing protein n=1 Tax=Treponema sp. TaxID=166 RepID=UPI00298EA8B7|nr:LytTR family DNA-binding domain-containing protein [Treponema sp.]MCQ2240706.1 LytTR family transcriptional regulator [Treponema sp.]
MKVTILDCPEGQEEEIIVKCCALDDRLVSLINSFKAKNEKLVFYKGENMVFIDQKDIFYIESIDDLVFAYTTNGTFESKEKLYQLEQYLSPKSFMRANKSTILNLNQVKSLSPAFGSRFEAILKNECKIIISRNYVPVLKDMLGL